VHAAGLGLRLPPALRTGGHRESARAVAEGRADLAALDAVTWALMQGYDAFVPKLRVLGHTRPTPGLPMIAAAGADTSATLAAVAEGIAALAPADRGTLHLQGLVQIPTEAYLAVPNPPPPKALSPPG
jgi:ABC-type phosphate/phosphonate transport system substrate-binding protein